MSLAVYDNDTPWSCSLGGKIVGPLCGVVWEKTFSETPFFSLLFAGPRFSSTSHAPLPHA